MILRILLLAILLRVLLMPFFFHPDIKTYNFQASFLKSGVWNIYDYLIDNRAKLPLKEEFVYFPLTYYVIGGYQIIVTPLLGNEFSGWLEDAGQSAIDRVGVFRFLFILKLPYLFLDIIIAFLMMSFFTEKAQKKKAFILWLFNPISIILIYVFSNVDIYPVFFTVLALMMVKKQQVSLAALFLGIGAGFKAYPLLFVPFLYTYATSFKDKVAAVLLPLIMLAVIIYPFFNSPGFKSASLASGLTNRIVMSNINIGWESLILSILALSVLFFISFTREKQEFIDFVKCCFVALLITFSFIHFHIQWVLWFMPFVIILVTYNTRLFSLLFFLLTLLIMIPLLYDDKSMTIGVFSLISPYFLTLPTPFTLVQRFYDPLIIQGILHSIFAGGSLVVSWNLFKR